MKCFDFIVVGGGIAGLLSAYMLKEHNTLLISEDGVLNSNASAAAGAFLFPKVGFDTAYTRFINSSIINALKFYESNKIDIHKKGVTILPRDERDIEKFKKYEKEIKLPFTKKGGGFYFKNAGVVFPEEIREKINVEFEIKKISSIHKDGECWNVGGYRAKNVILATGHKEILNIPYIKIRPIWGERIEGVCKEIDKLPTHYHKNCSLGEINGLLKIGATHKRRCPHCSVNEKEAFELIEKANEIIPIGNLEITKITGGFRAASVDYFPVVGKIIDVNKTLGLNPKIVKGEIPKAWEYIKGLYIINAMGGRGFSNAYTCAYMLKSHILKNESLGVIDTKRLFIKWARKEGENYLRGAKGEKC